MALDPVVGDPAGLPNERLEAEICELAGHMWAAECRWLLMVGEFDRREGWAGVGIQSCAHWLSWRCGVALGVAREKVRVARRLVELPLITDAFSKGELSYAKVRALTRVANDANEPELVEIARAATASQLERIVRTYRRAQVQEGLVEANQRHAARQTRWYWDDDGSFVLSARLAPEDGAVVLAALEAGRPTEIPDKTTPAGVSAETPPAVARNADALVGAARLALAAAEQTDRGDAPCQVVLHVDAPVLADDEAEGRCYLEDGPSVPPETARRLSCDAEIIAVTHAGDGGTLLDVGRKTRAISPGMRRALRVRDGGCRYPGCSNHRFVDGHHILHWGQHGETKLPNLVLLCRRHHRLVHEEGYGLTTPAPDVFVFTRPDGRPIPEVQTLAPLTGPGLQERHRREGLTIDARTCRSLGEGESFDLGMTIDAILYPELRRRGRTCGGAARGAAQPAVTWSYPQVHERLVEAIPEFAPLLDEHVQDFDEILPNILFDTLTRFVLDARERGDDPLVAKCLAFLAAAMRCGDEQIEHLVAATFVETVGPWDPAMNEFIDSWPEALRHEAMRQRNPDLDAGAA
ncbi:MAG: HNH endonuclease [Actinomycetota bacterium]|nr:HNH endonuclease [Actinomycetota bacterium]